MVKKLVCVIGTICILHFIEPNLEAKEGAQIILQTGHTGSILSVAFSPNGKHIASGSDDKTLLLWERATGEQVRVFKGHTGPVRSVAFSPNGKHIVSGSNDKTLRLWKTATGKQVRVFKTPSMASLLFGGAKAKQVRAVKGHTDRVLSVAFSHDGKHIASGSSDARVKLWHSKTGQLLLTLVGFKDGEWVVYTRNNYYNSSQKAIDM